jgi:hypothetical protein
MLPISLVGFTFVVPSVPSGEGCQSWSKSSSVSCSSSLLSTRSRGFPYFTFGLLLCRLLL